MFYIAICDDESAFINALRDGIRKVMAERGSERYQIDEYTHTADLVRRVEEGMTYHILFLDIMLGVDNGIVAAMKLRDAHGLKSSIIFVSSHPQFAVETFRVVPDTIIGNPLELSNQCYFELLLVNGGGA